MERTSEHTLGGLTIHTNSILKLQCKYCDIEFSNHQDLQSHISLKHENQSQTRANKCQICVKEFDTVQELVSHFTSEHSKSIKKEQEIKICNLCNETFDSEQEYKKHTKLHEPYEAKFERI